MTDNIFLNDWGEIRLYATADFPDYLESLNIIRSAGWHRVNSLYRISRPNGSIYPLIIATVSGSGIIRIKNKSYVAMPGSLFLIPSNCFSEYMGVDSNLWEFLWIHYSGVHADCCTRDIERTGNYYCDIGNTEMNQLFSSIQNPMQNGNGLDMAFEQSNALDHILHCMLMKTFLHPSSNGFSRIVEEIIEYIDQSTELNLDDLAGKFHFSKEYIIRLFKKKTGYTPYQYWSACRLKKSCVELEETMKPIKEIALSLGYRNVCHFITQFKNHMGITPGKYRESYSIFKN